MTLVHDNNIFKNNIKIQCKNIKSYFFLRYKIHCAYNINNTIKLTKYK